MQALDRFTPGLLEQSDLKAALQGFQEVVRMEAEKGEWGFKAMKQIVKLHFQMGNTDEMLSSYRCGVCVVLCVYTGHLPQGDADLHQDGCHAQRQ